MSCKSTSTRYTPSVLVLPPKRRSGTPVYRIYHRDDSARSTVSRETRLLLCLLLILAEHMLIYGQKKISTGSTYYGQRGVMPLISSLYGRSEPAGEGITRISTALVIYRCVNATEISGALVVPSRLRSRRPYRIP